MLRRNSAVSGSPLRARQITQQFAEDIFRSAIDHIGEIGCGVSEVPRREAHMGAQIAQRSVLGRQLHRRILVAKRTLVVALLGECDGSIIKDGHVIGRKGEHLGVVGNRAVVVGTRTANVSARPA